MKKVIVKDKVLAQAAGESIDAFLKVIIDAINDSVNGELTTETMAELSADQITLLAWNILHEEVMDGGYVQLIHNGYGAFIFKNPFAKAVKEWGLVDLARHIRRAYKLYERYHEQIEQDCTDEEFMALFEQMPQFDEFDDEFVESEEDWTELVAHYVDDHLEEFVEII